MPYWVGAPRNRNGYRRIESRRCTAFAWRSRPRGSRRRRETCAQFVAHLAQHARGEARAVHVDEVLDGDRIMGDHFAQGPRERLYDHVVAVADQARADRERPRGISAATATGSMVPPAGFEPAISALKGLRPGPLDDRGGRRIIRSRTATLLMKKSRPEGRLFRLVAGVGFEPTTFGL